MTGAKNSNNDLNDNSLDKKSWLSLFGDRIKRAGSFCIKAPKKGYLWSKKFFLLMPKYLGSLFSAFSRNMQEVFSPKYEALDSYAIKSFLQEGGGKKEYFSLLKDLFSPEFIQKSLQQRHQNFDEVLSQKECIEILAHVGYSITYQDLQKIFYDWQQNDLHNFSIVESFFLEHSWLQPLSLEQLSSTSFYKLVECFHNPFKLLYKCSELPDILDRLENSTHSSTWKMLFLPPMHANLVLAKYSLFLHKLVKNKKAHAKTESLFAAKELLAKIFAYLDPKSIKQGQLLPVYNEVSKKIVYCEIVDVLQKDGLHAYICRPILDKEQLQPIQIIFRGTHDWTSLYRDMDPSGVGKKTFTMHQDFLQKTLHKSYFTDASVDVIGHSLGAVDAQRALILLTDTDNVSMPANMRLFAYCSPKLDEESVHVWKRHLHALMMQEKKPAIELFFAFHENDIVTWFGDSYLTRKKGVVFTTKYLVVKANDPKTVSFFDKSYHMHSFFKDGEFDSQEDARSYMLYEQEHVSKDLVEKQILAKQNTTQSRQWHQELLNYCTSFFTKEDMQKEKDIQEKVHKKFSELEKQAQELSTFEETFVQKKSHTLRFTNYALKCIFQIVHPFITKKRSSKDD